MNETGDGHREEDGARERECVKEKGERGQRVRQRNKRNKRRGKRQKEEEMGEMDGREREGGR